MQDRHIRDALDELKLNQLVGQQLQRPTRLTVRRRTARQERQVRFDLTGNFGFGTWPRLVIQGRFQALQHTAGGSG